jgi:chaperonin cofactor prefoldin
VNWKSQDKCIGTLKEQLATIKLHLEELHQKKEDRAKQFVEVRRQITYIFVGKL